MVDKVRIIGNLLFAIVVGTLFFVFFYTGARNAQVTANVILNEEQNGITSEIKQSIPDLKFNQSNLSYAIEEHCSLNQVQRLRLAFSIISEETPLRFYETKALPSDIVVLCSALNNTSKNPDTSKVAEGGPTLLTDKEILEGKIILYNNSNSINCTKPLAEIHEILHVLGFVHTLKEKSIMYPIISCQQEIDTEIKNILVKLYGS